jgi:hypothetical protein
MGRKVVAVGNLHSLWLDLPYDISIMEELSSSFEGFFGRQFGEVMLGKELPYIYHRDWSAYVAVADLKEGPGWPFWEMTAFHIKPEDTVYRVMVG